MEIRNNIPNAITAGNLLAGCIGIVLVFQEGPEGPFYASCFILLAGFFDLLDGLVARAIGASSEIGGQLDSLADLVSFGVLPSLICFKYLQANLGVALLGSNEGTPVILKAFPYLAFIIAIFAAVRLARFNLDSEQSKEFKGVPVPANAIFWAGIPLALQGPDHGILVVEAHTLFFMLTPPFLILMAILFSSLMVASTPFISLKFQHFRWKGNEGRYILIGATLLLFSLFFFKAIPFLVLLYVALSLILQPKAS